MEWIGGRTTYMPHQGKILPIQQAEEDGQSSPSPTRTHHKVEDIANMLAQVMKIHPICWVVGTLAGTQHIVSPLQNIDCSMKVNKNPAESMRFLMLIMFQQAEKQSVAYRNGNGIQSRGTNSENLPLVEKAST